MNSPSARSSSVPGPAALTLRPTALVMTGRTAVCVLVTGGSPSVGQGAGAPGVVVGGAVVVSGPPQAVAEHVAQGDGLAVQGPVAGAGVLAVHAPGLGA